jgi:hypothetical protein
MLTLLMYAVCLCLAFKGVQILQIAIVSTGPFRKIAMSIGFLSLVVTTGAAIGLAVWFTYEGWSFDQHLIEVLTGPQTPIR